DPAPKPAWRGRPAAAGNNRGEPWCIRESYITRTPRPRLGRIASPSKAGYDVRSLGNNPSGEGIPRWPKVESHLLVERTILIPEGADRTAVLGAADRNVKLIREALGVMVGTGNGPITIRGEDAAVNRAASVFLQ